MKERLRTYDGTVPARVRGFRSIDGIPFEPIRIDSAALVMAADFLAAEGCEVDEILLGQAITLYLESERAA